MDACRRRFGRIAARTVRSVQPPAYLRSTGRAALVIAVYTLAAQIGLRFAAFHGNASPVWPASAISLCALLLLGTRLWPAIWIGAFLNSIPTGAPILNSAITATGVTLGAALGARALRWRGFRPQLETIRDYVLLCLYGGLVASAVSAAIGVSSLALAGFVSRRTLPSAFEFWLAGDAFGIVLLAPLLLTVASRPFRWPTFSRGLEATGLVLAMGLALIAGREQNGYPYLPFVCLIWAVVRFDLRVTAGLVAATAASAVIWSGDLSGGGTSQSDGHDLLQLYRFIGVFGAVGPVFAILLEENRRSFRRTRQTAREFESVFRSSPLPKTVVSTVTGRIIDTNQAFTRLFGWHPEEVQGRTHADLDMWASDADRQRFQRLASDTNVESFSTTLRCRDGRVIKALLSTSTMTGDDESRRLTTIQDITKVEQLEQQVAQTQRMESLGRLAGGIAHDVNNSLSVITGHAELLAEEVAERAPARGHIEQIVAASQQSSRLTKQLLAFSRGQALKMEAVDLNAEVRGIQSMLQRLIGEHVRLKISLSPDIGLIHADRGQVEQVLLNLVVNARDAMPTGGEIVIRTATWIPDVEARGENGGLRSGKCTLLSVGDTGDGMKEEVRRRIFEPFYTTKESAGGTGLGLSVVHGIVRQFGGDIDVESSPGQGTRFDIFFPLASAASTSGFDGDAGRHE